MFKKHMMASPGTAKIAHKGKGSQMAPMPQRKEISQLAQPGQQSINDYAKATPMAQGQPEGPSEGGGFGM